MADVDTVSDPTGFGRGLPAVALGLLMIACEAPPPSGLAPTDRDPAEIFCTIPEDQIHSGGPGKDGFPALTGPVMADAGTPGAAYLGPEERVIGIVIEGQPFAIPHRVLWWHEIMNLNVGSTRLAVTYCPLTGSSMAFDRSAIEGAEFGVSGLLFQNNLIMYDRRTEESFWPQMLAGARCGAATGTELQIVPVVEMTWQGWTDLHPDTKVPAHDLESGQDFANYGYPYGNYEEPDNSGLLFPLPSIDPRRPPKERVLGVPTRGTAGVGGIAFPFGELNALGSVGAAHGTGGGHEVVVFWDGLRQGAMTFYPTAGSRGLSFETSNATIVDLETGSTWTIEGLAIDGPLVGTQLEPVAEAYVAFWFAWAAFNPTTQIWVAR
jgi:hypothetical protein